MTDDRMALIEARHVADDGNFLRSLAESVLRLLMEADVEGPIGAGRHERSSDRTTWRNGRRERTPETRLGPLNLKVPKLRTGSCFPGFLEPRKPVEKALVTVIRGRRGSQACPRARSTTWCRPGASAASARAKSPSSAARPTSMWVRS